MQRKNPKQIVLYAQMERDFEAGHRAYIAFQGIISAKDFADKVIYLGLQRLKDVNYGRTGQ